MGKKRYNMYISIDTFEWLQERADKLTDRSIAALIAKMIEFCRKNWKSFIKEV